MRALAAPTLACALALVAGCNAFGDVEPPPEGAAGAVDGATDQGASGQGASGPGSASNASQASGSAGTGAPSCTFPTGKPACEACVEQKCDASLGPTCAAELAATLQLGVCFGGGGCACENGFSNCFRLFEEAVDPESQEAFALSACIKANCRPVCDCCEM